MSAAGALFVDDHGKVLLVEPTYKEHWEIPGGYIEPGETPSQACARELVEELGMPLPIGRLLVVDWAPTELDSHKVLFIFDGGTLTPPTISAIRLNPTELASYEFVPPPDLPARLIPRLTRRLLAAIDAQRTGRTVYLEAGRPI